MLQNVSANVEQLHCISSELKGLFPQTPSTTLMASVFAERTATQINTKRVLPIKIFSLLFTELWPRSKSHSFPVKPSPHPPAQINIPTAGSDLVFQHELEILGPQSNTLFDLISFNSRYGTALSGLKL